jgi:type III secretion protein L
MTLLRGRVVKGAFPDGASGTSDASGAPPTRRSDLARRMPREALAAKDESARLVEEARAKADAIVAEARVKAAGIAEQSAREAREQEIAKVAAELFAMRITEEQRAERGLDRTVEVAVLLAERIVGEALRVEPERIAAIATEALRETRGARKVSIEACPDDVATLAALLGPDVATITPSDELRRGSLVVHTDLGRVDARLEPQLARLAAALREALR